MDLVQLTWELFKSFCHDKPALSHCCSDLSLKYKNNKFYQRNENLAPHSVLGLKSLLSQQYNISAVPCKPLALP